ncbi:hypothetical protein VNO77_20632 [Canavalia gladiata]|uniref:Uncharacterized protein n=1 Tax=Canavalia gladiata TaxID=3824 RepID=A0AAN9LPU4_CANGL
MASISVVDFGSRRSSIFIYGRVKLLKSRAYDTNSDMPQRSLNHSRAEEFSSSFSSDAHTVSRLFLGNDSLQKHESDVAQP